MRLAVGAAPEEKASEAGNILGGPDGTWFPILYRNAGVPFSEVSIINLVQCLPPGKAEFPTEPIARRILGEAEAHQAVAHCRKAYVEPMLESRPWERVDLFGDEPLKALGGKSGLERFRGTPLHLSGDSLSESLRNGIRTVPTYAPAYLMRDQNMVPVAVNDLRKPLVKEEERYNVYPSLEDVRAFKFKTFAFDIECSRANNDEIYMVGLSGSPFESLVVPFTEQYIPELKRIFAEAEEVIGQNLVQFDLPILARAGVVIRGPRECRVWDLMLMHHLRFPTFPHSLDFIGRQFTNKGAWKYDKADFEVYCARDTDVTFRCFEPLKRLLEQAKLLDIYLYISWPMGMICAQMTKWGFKRSPDRLKELRVKYLGDIANNQDDLPEDIRTRWETKNRRVLAPEGTLNDKGKPLKYLYEPYQEEIRPWKSPDVKKHLLYETYGLPVQFKVGTKDKITVDKTALDKLFNRLNNPSQVFLKEYGEEKIAEMKRVVKNLRNLNGWATRLAGFAKDSELPDELIHPSFNVHGTETGRLSSSGPNAQNIPEEARFMYIPRFEGGRIVSVDYSGIENRLVAFLANDVRRKQWFKDPDYSEHKYLASVLEGIPYDQVVKSKEKDSWYAIAKVVVHGSDRMMGSKKIWENNDLDPTTVKEVHAKWKSLISDTISWQRRVADNAERIGWVMNPFGRKLWLWEKGSATRAVSFLPQSTAFDVLARAMIGLLFERIGWPEEWARKVCPVVEPLPDGVYLNLQVHDELVTETEDEALVKPAIATLTKVMTQPWPELGGLSLPVGVGFGKSWGECN